MFYDSQEKHTCVRREIVEHITKNISKYSAFTSQVQQHTDNMRKSGVGATLVEILAAVGMYGVPLYIYTLTPNESSGSATHQRHTQTSQVTPTVNLLISWMYIMTSF